MGCLLISNSEVEVTVFGHYQASFYCFMGDYLLCYSESTLKLALFFGLFCRLVYACVFTYVERCMKSPKFLGLFFVVWCFLYTKIKGIAPTTGIKEVLKSHWQSWILPWQSVNLVCYLVDPCLQRSRRRCLFQVSQTEMPVVVFESADSKKSEALSSFGF